MFLFLKIQARFCYFITEQPTMKEKVLRWRSHHVKNHPSSLGVNKTSFVCGFLVTTASKTKDETEEST